MFDKKPDLDSLFRWIVHSQNYNKPDPDTLFHQSMEEPDELEYDDFESEDDLSEPEAVSDELMHYGVKRRSGRYPWGSGDNPYQHSGDFLARYEQLRAAGKSEKNIAEEMEVDGTARLRVYVQRAKHERRQLEIDRIKSLRADGLSNREIARRLGYTSESSVRSKLNEESAERMNRAEKTADILRSEVGKKSMIDVGAGVERELGISSSKLAEAVMILEGEGYNRYGVSVPNATNPSKRTVITVLAKPDIDYKYAIQHVNEVKPLTDYYSTDGGDTYHKLQYPASIDSKRVAIRYGDEGGLAADGTMYIRRGVPDLNLGNSHYAQVRILVDGTHYLKGMAMYSDDLPDGADILFNTNKPSGTDKMKVLKEIKHDDPNNPFNAAIKANGQSTYMDKDGKEHLSAINKLKEEGDWDTMARNLSPQFLGKQPLQLIKRQLGLTYDNYKSEYDDIMSLTNPTIKRKLLEDFANGCDSATVHLKSVPLPGQSTQVILPLSCVSDKEIYAPNYENGTKVALVRFPHGGTFEIPYLTVNNKNPEAKKILGNPKDAVGINAKVAEQLSGADFDGDQVVVIPTSASVQIKHDRPLKGLVGFDPKTEYAVPEGNPNHVKLMTKSETQKQMGVVSNLITDMTLRFAPESDIVRAVKHSMVVIDAEKHKLDYKRSEKENGITELKKKYQSRVTPDGEYKEGGASTLLSRKKQTVYVPERRGSVHVDPETGKLVYKESGRTYVDEKTGKVKEAQTKVSLMSTVDDAYALSSGTPQENLYADYANKLKRLAETARKESVTMPRLEYKKEAKERYAEEVSSLNAKLNVASMNAPRERQAQIMTYSQVKAIKQDNPDIDKKDLKKIKNRLINESRSEVGARGKETKIDITDNEWKAIQAGAITDTKLTQILRYADTDKVRSLATPRASTELPVAKQNKIKQMVASGYTNAEIAKAVGVSTSTVFKYM